jgi:hypothetical protein
MKDIQIKLSISKEIGEVSGEIFEADEQRKFLVLAHGAGAGMKHPFMTSLSKELAERGVGSLRFNFPFIEQKKKRPDFPAVAEKTIEVAIKKAMELYPDARHSLASPCIRQGNQASNVRNICPRFRLQCYSCKAQRIHWRIGI